MPQAGSELWEKMCSYFANGGFSDAEPYDFLVVNGWSEEKGLLMPPVGREITQKEWDCANFLCEEWDYAIQ